MRPSRRSEASCLSTAVRSATLTGVTRLQCLPTGHRCSLHQPRRTALSDPLGIQSVVNRCPLRHRTTVLAPMTNPRRRASTIVSAQSITLATAAMTLRRTPPHYATAAVCVPGGLLLSLRAGDKGPLGCRMTWRDLLARPWQQDLSPARGAVFATPASRPWRRRRGPPRR